MISVSEGKKMRFNETKNHLVHISIVSKFVMRTTFFMDRQYNNAWFAFYKLFLSDQAPISRIKIDFECRETSIVVIVVIVSKFWVSISSFHASKSYANAGSL